MNELDVFDRLAVFYALMGMAFLFFLFFSVFKPAVGLKKIQKVLLVLLLIGFAAHTLGLGLRWYVREGPLEQWLRVYNLHRWTTVLAGLLFSRKSLGGFGRHHGAFGHRADGGHADYRVPEITPLVPVLRSYWLTIHVSMEAGSYGFLALGAVIGLINWC